MKDQILWLRLLLILAIASVIITLVIYFPSTPISALPVYSDTTPPTITLTDEGFDQASLNINARMRVSFHNDTGVSYTLIGAVGTVVTDHTIYLPTILKSANTAQPPVLGTYMPTAGNTVVQTTDCLFQVPFPAGATYTHEYLEPGNCLFYLASSPEIGGEITIAGYSGPTQFSGQILDANDASNGITTPLVGATVTHLESGISSTTDSDGYFILSNLPSGFQHFDFDGTTATPVNTYGAYRAEKLIVAGMNNVVERPIYIMAVDMSSATQVTPDMETIVYNPNLDVTITIPPNTVYDENGQLYDGQMTISQVPVGFTPGTLPDTLIPASVVTIQPMGLTFDQPAPISFPNTEDLPPGSEVDIWSMDHATSEFFIAGKGRVTANGAMIETFEGGIREASWHLPMPPQPNGESGESGANNDPDDDCGSNASSYLTHNNGCLYTAVQLPSYTSLGEDRALNIVYSADRAYPYLLTPFEMTILRRAAVPPLTSYQMSIGGVDLSPQTYLNTSGLSEEQDETLRAVAAIDASYLITGSYLYRIRQTSHYPNSQVSNDLYGRTIIVNGQDSAFGAGWDIAGLQRLYFSNDRSVTLVDGSGMSRFFQVAPTGGNGLNLTLYDTPDPIQAVTDRLVGLTPGSFTVTTGGQTTTHLSYATPIVNFPDIGFDNMALYNVGLNGVVDVGSTATAPQGDDISIQPPGGNDNFVAAFDGFLFLPDGGEVTFTVNVDDLFELFVDGVSVMNRLSGCNNCTFSTVVPNLPAGFVPIKLNFGERTGEANIVLSASGGGLPGGVIPPTYLFTSNSFPTGPISFMSPSGTYSTLRENVDGTFIHQLKDGTQYRFNAAGYQTAMIDRNGNMTMYAYDAQNRLVTITDPTGLVTTLAYANGRLRQITDPTGRQTTFTHDANGNLVSVTLPDTTNHTFGYNNRHLMTSETDGRGHTVTRTFNEYGQLTQASLPDGTVRQAAAAQSIGLVPPGQGTINNPAPITRPAAAQSLFTNGEGEVTTFFTGRFGEATQIVDAAGLATTFVRDEDGHPTQTTLPSGAVFDRIFSDNGNMLSLTDNTLGGTTVFTYENSFNRVTSVTDPFNQTTLFDYDASGNLTQIQTPLNRTIGMAYNGQGMLSNLTDTLGTVTAFTYDNQGNMTNLVSGTGAGQRTAVMTYTPAGYLSTLSDPLSRNFSFTYDVMGRLTGETTPDNRTINYGYDAAGNMTSLTPPGRPSHTFTYNELDLMTSYTAPTVSGSGTNQTTYAYNFAQQLELVTRPDGLTLDYQYDPAGRLDALVIPHGTYNYSYAPATGQLNQINAPGGINLGYTYNGEVLTGVSWSGPVNGAVGYGYDAAARLTNLTITDSSGLATPFSFSYDADDMLTQAGDLSLTYNAQTGLISGTTLDATTDSWSFNAFTELSGYSAAFNGGTVFNVQYTRDNLGRITQKVETVSGQITTTTYTYDLAGHLATETINGSTIATYTYDSNGNRLSDGVNSAAYDVQDRLLQYGAASYTYTANGELLTKTEGDQTITYNYDVLGNLVGVTLPNGTQIIYLIDGQNRRIGKLVNGVLVQGFLYQDGLNPVAELDSSGNIVSLFIYASQGNVPDYMIQNGVRYRIVSDHLGSPRLVINTQTGVIAQQMNYTAFGKVTQNTAPDLQPFGFAGGIYDADTDLVRFGARDYDAEMGRWTAKDPILFLGDIPNLYVYTKGDSVNKLDPSGKAVPLVVAFAAGVLVETLTPTPANAPGPEDPTYSNNELANAAGYIVGEVAGKFIPGSSVPVSQLISNRLQPNPIPADKVSSCGTIPPSCYRSEDGYTVTCY